MWAHVIHHCSVPSHTNKLKTRALLSIALYQSGYIILHCLLFTQDWLTVEIALQLIVLHTSQARHLPHLLQRVLVQTKPIQSWINVRAPSLHCARAPWWTFCKARSTNAHTHTPDHWLLYIHISNHFNIFNIFNALSGLWVCLNAVSCCALTACWAQLWASRALGTSAALAVEMVSVTSDSATKYNHDDHMRSNIFGPAVGLPAGKNSSASPG